MDTILNILNTANLWMFTAFAVAFILLLGYYLHSANKVHKKYISTFSNLSAKALVEKLEKSKDVNDKPRVLQKFHIEVTNIRQREWYYPYITYQCRKLLKEYIDIKSIYIDVPTSEKYKIKTSRFCQKDCVLALQIAHNCKEYSCEISRANSDHFVDIFGGKADSYKKHLSTNLTSNYIGKDEEIEKLHNVINYLKENNPNLSFDKTKTEIDKLRTSQK